MSNASYDQRSHSHASASPSSSSRNPHSPAAQRQREALSSSTSPRSAPPQRTPTALSTSYSEVSYVSYSNVPASPGRPPLVRASTGGSTRSASGTGRGALVPADAFGGRSLAPGGGGGGYPYRDALAHANLHSINVETEEERASKDRMGGRAKQANPVKSWLLCGNPSKETMESIKESLTVECAYSSAKTRQMERERLQHEASQRAMSREATRKQVRDEEYEVSRAKHLETEAARQRALQLAQLEVARAEKTAAASASAASGWGAGFACSIM